MTIRAIALLHISHFTPPLGSGMTVKLLDDAVLLDLAMDFGEEPEAFARSLSAALGDELGQHADPRGVLVLPSVAPLTARSYAALVDEVGEAGQWVSLVQEGALDGFALPDGLGGLAAIFGSMLQHMPEAVLEAASAAARGDDAAFSAIGEHVASAMGHVGARPGALPAPELGALPPELMALLGGAGLDVESPTFQAALTSVKTQLENDPEAFKQMAERLFGGAPGDEDDEDD